MTSFVGTGLDGALVTSGGVSHVVQNKVGLYDGDMVVKQYSSLTITAGNTMTVDQPSRGMLIYVQGNCVINGALSMKGKGPAANPTISGGSDGNPVSINGLQIPFVTSSNTGTLAGSIALFNGCGLAARLAIANHTSSISTTITITRTGAAGGVGAVNNFAGSPGANGGVGQSGGGGGGDNDGNSVRLNIFSITSFSVTLFTLRFPPCSLLPAPPLFC